MPEQYRRDNEGWRDAERRGERGDDRPRRGGDWRGGGAQWQPERDDRGYAASDRGGISRETGFDRGISRDERNSRDWQQRVSEDDQGYRSQRSDREWQGEPDWQTDRPRGSQSGRDWSQGSDRDRSQWRASEEPWHRSHEQWRGSHEYGGGREGERTEQGRYGERGWSVDRGWRNQPHDAQGGRSREAEQDRFGTGGSREYEQDWNRGRGDDRDPWSRTGEGRRHGGWNEGFGGETWQARGEEPDRAMGSPGAGRNEQWRDERGREGGRGPGGAWPWGGGGGPMSTWGIGGSESPRGIGGTREGAWPGYSGRGPKGYKRSDDRIREEISDRLTDDHHVDASDISVEVRDGQVTLSGTVPDRDQKRRAEELAERVNGVSDVTINLRVNRQSGPAWQTAGQPGSHQVGQHVPIGGQQSWQGIHAGHDQSGDRQQAATSGKQQPATQGGQQAKPTGSASQSGEQATQAGPQQGSPAREGTPGGKTGRTPGTNS